MPLFVRAGSILPTGPAVQSTADRCDPTLTLHVFTGADGAFTLYEDDGVSRQYLHGAAARIPLRWNQASGTLTIGARQGAYPGMAARRTIRVIWYDPRHPRGVAFDRPADETIAYSGAEVENAGGDDQAARSSRIRTSAFSASCSATSSATYGGEALFRRIEYIRSTSVDRHRGVAAADAIDPGLDALSLDDTLAFVRGFMLFSLLANLAEDRQGVVGRARRDRGRGARPARSEAGSAQAEVAALLDQALIVPVLTAHPTEVRRKSHHRPSQPHRRADAAARRRARRRPRTATWSRQAISRQIALLWQTRPLRRERLYVADEVETALVLSARRLPAGAAGALRALGARARAAAAELPAARQLDRRRPRRQSLRHRGLAASSRWAAPPRRCSLIYLDEVHALGAELSISTELAEVPADVDGARRPLAATSGAARARRALSPRADRHLRAGSPPPIWRFTGDEAPRPRQRRRASPMPSPTNSAPTSTRRHRSPRRLGELGEGGRARRG